jgi:predicted membrane protein
MFRMPGSSDNLLGWGAPLALVSVWAGLAAVVLSVQLWFIQYRDIWVTVAFLILDPGTLAAGVLVLWIHRRREADEAVRMQRLQAMVGIALGLAAVAVGYLFVLGHKSPFTPVGDAGR